MASLGFERHRQNIRDLENELTLKKFPYPRYASFGIVGPAGTGRKTLGYRFSQMNERAIENVIPLYSYSSRHDRYYGRDLAYRRLQMYINGYIIDQPVELPRRQPPYYVNEWRLFRCLLFVFDLSDIRSLNNTSQYLTSFRNFLEYMPECYLVGNKSDLRQPPGENAHEVSQSRAIFEAAQQGATFYECSAKYNTGVAPLLDRILDQAYEGHH